MNLLDVFMSEQTCARIGRALAGRRERLLIQGHIGACRIDGQYTVSRDPEASRKYFEDLLVRLNTDYIDIGMIHFVDRLDEWEGLKESGFMRYALELKRSGVIKALGISSHDPVTAKRAVDSGLIDVLMFSLNPAYDLVPKERGLTEVFTEVMDDQPQDFTSLTLEPVRAELYRACEEKGVGITVMKVLAMGTLLKMERSPLGVELSVAQCIDYALKRPAMAAVMVGMQRPCEVDAAMEYLHLSDAERDCAQVLGSLGMFSAAGRCMYCNHCLPCPAGIDICAVNKYLDLVELDGRPADGVRQRYLALKNAGGACLGCGACESRCPYNVEGVRRMVCAAEIFGN